MLDWTFFLLSKYTGLVLLFLVVIMSLMGMSFFSKQLLGNKPRMIVYNKADLANRGRYHIFMQYRLLMECKYQKFMSNPSFPGFGFAIRK